MSAALRRARREGDDRIICDRLEIADSTRERMVGLMGRERLEPGDGLSIETNSIHMLFMRFPIDALFLSKPDADGLRRVVSMRPHLPAWRGVVWYVRGAKLVLELPAGTLERHAVQLGDLVAIEDREPASIAPAPAPAAAEERAA
jgi:uncharacterized membrane protein (UPF0127 family)